MHPCEGEGARDTHPTDKGTRMPGWTLPEGPGQPVVREERAHQHQGILKGWCDPSGVTIRRHGIRAISLPRTEATSRRSERRRNSVKIFGNDEGRKGLVTERRQKLWEQRRNDVALSMECLCYKRRRKLSNHCPQGGGGVVRNLEWRNLVRENLAPNLKCHCEIWFSIPRLWHKSRL